MTRKTLTLLATLGSAALIFGALGFQYIGGLYPCKLCYWQRYGHFAAIVAGVLALFVPARALLWIGAAGAGSSSVIAIYHTGVERGWWEGPTTCSGGPVGDLSTDELFNQIMNAPVIRCDEIPWEMFGLSMANLNIVASAVVAMLFVLAVRAKA
ncbi:disulfide bond formation protein B [Sagittula stellata]|uniref:Disulfide bond formation protein, DsbB family n=1 Tax=Sagittula stellata (strain ATCC 700073 / DSM 11524 / E-37) TaxID=388399 RepID=A3KA31_SAGS3|nr:disulfide bond formation protein B [Sagittula stellata]EBA05974.1 disulfide bond formation protein, DsbB family [Sagittula stellata E-37]